MLEAAALGEIFLTATGDMHVIDRAHFERMRDGAVLANAGHFDVEVNVAALRSMAVAVRHPRQHVEELVLKDGRRLHLLAEGRLVNLAAAEGHPASVMDMSFANQALVVEYLVLQGADLTAAVHPVPRRIDEEVARLKLAALGTHIDTLTPEQARYVTSWKEGT
jgi:adenosylhomocysteinase